MLTKHGSIHRVVIPDGENVPGPLNASGSSLFIVNTVGRIRVKIDDQPENILKTGQGFNAFAGDTFSRIEFRSVNGKRTELDVWVGYTEFIDRRLDQIAAPSLMVPYPLAAIPPKQTVDFKGNPTKDLIRRESITISNESSEGKLKLVNASGYAWGIVRPGESITHHTSEYVGVYNESGAAISVVIGENWWIA